MKKWRCTVCGEIVESDVRPDKCPVCGVPGEKFVEVVEEDNAWATEHVVGVAKRVTSRLNCLKVSVPISAANVPRLVCISPWRGSPTGKAIRK